MNHPNYKLIELARASRGYTQKDVVSLLPSITQSTLSKIEKGQITLTESTLEKFASVLNYPVTFFYQEELQTPVSNIYFRKRTSITQKSFDKIMSDVKIILKSIDILLDNIELTEFQKKYYDISDGWTPESAAIRVREIFKIPSGPIKDVVKALEDEGIIVYFYDTNESKFDGLTAYTDKGYPVIFVNSNLPNDRIRFTICHELGHLFLHIPCDVEPWRDVEIEANKFASEFLMPSKDCVADFFDFSFPKLMSLKSYWGISKAAIIRRAKDLEVINQGTYIYMMKELGRRNERKHEPGFVEVDEPNILKEIIGLLRTELEYDNEMMASEMHLNVSDFNGYFDAQEKPRVKVRVLRPAI